MEHQPTISVLIPSYNQAEYLVKTLGTIAKQDYRKFEVIVADGGSTDRTADVVGAYGSLVTRFVSERDRGQLDGVAKALALATGDVCYWCNADDAVLPGGFRFVADTFGADSQLEFLFSDSYAFNEAERWLGSSGRISTLRWWDHFLFYRQMPSEGIFWRRDISHAALPLDYSLRVYTDYSFFLPLWYNRRAKWTGRRLGAFRIQPNQNSKVFRERGDRERELIKQRMRERLGLTDADFKRLQRRRRLSFAIWQQLYPKAFSGGRFLWRKLTADAARKRDAELLFNEWLSPPAGVRAALGDDFCDRARRAPAATAPSNA